MMDLESGNTIYVEATIHRSVALVVLTGKQDVPSMLTTEEARTLANALLAAVVEAEAYSTSR
jgi:urease beta subunit